MVVAVTDTAPPVLLSTVGDVMEAYPHIRGTTWCRRRLNSDPWSNFSRRQQRGHLWQRAPM